MMKIKPAIFALIFSTALFSTNLYAEKESFSQNRLGLENNHDLKPKSKAVIASFYGQGFHGKKTANGEIFNQHAMTAASNTYPFNTKLRATCATTGKSVVVRINDTGGFHKYGRSIDLSQGAAEKLGIIKKGVAKVYLEVLK